MAGVGAKSRCYFGKAFESALGANATQDLSFLVQSDVSFTPTEEVDSLVSGQVVSTTVTRTALAAGGTIKSFATSQLLAAWWKYVMHAAPTTTGGGDPYSHTWTDFAAASVGGINEENVKSFTMQHQIANDTFNHRFDGMIATELTLSGSGSGKIDATLSVAGIGDVVATTEPSVTLPTETYYQGRKTVLSVGGTDRSTALDTWTLNFKNGMGVVDRAGSTNGEGTAIDRVGLVEVTFEYTIKEGATADAGGYDDFVAQTNRAYILTIQGDSNRDCVITISNGRTMAYPEAISGPEFYKTPRKIMGLYLAASTPDFLTVVVRNGVASYA